MDYALASRNDDLMNKSAPLLVGRSSVEMVELFKTSSRIISWASSSDLRSCASLLIKNLYQQFKYREKWDEVVQLALNFSESRESREVSRFSSKGCTMHGCKSRDETTIRIMRKLGNGVKSIRNLNDTFDTSSSRCCSTYFGISSSHCRGTAFGTSSYCCCVTGAENIRKWREQVERAIEGIPSFASILNGDHDDT